MQELITEGIARLAGASSQAIFHLKQAMGGGKTHLLVGFGLLAKHPSLRKKHCGGILHLDAFETANIAAFNGRNQPDHFFWGEIATQLGKAEQFKRTWTSGPKAPDEKDWIGLFDGDEPILILMDEMPPYFHYYDTQKVGNGTVADIATRAFANMLTAAGKKKNVCVVVSDLSASYDSGTRLITKALDDARQELGRQERHITPVDLALNEIYDILRKRLFMSLPDKAEIEDIADAYGRKLAEAAKSKVTSRGAESIADEIAATYPFHPRLKNVVALFKENEQFKQTRGLIELVSRLLRSVWDRKDNDIFLIGPQHFDLSIAEVRDKLTEISGMRDVIAMDLWNTNQSSRYAIIDGRDMTEEAIRPRVKGETTFVDGLIEFAVGTANQCLVPHGIDERHWKEFDGVERFYLKLIDLEAKGFKTLDNYQNFAKAFKVRDFRALMGNQKANEARLKSAVEFAKSEMSEGAELYGTVLRAVLYAIMELARETDGNEVLAHLTLNVPDDYADMTRRERVVEIADYLARHLEALRPEEASAARVLRELVKNQRLG